MSDLISSINLCRVITSPTHQIDFTTIEKQKEYFESKITKSFNNCSYVPRSGKITISGYVDNSIFQKSNYGFYENSYNGTTKRFYFWILERNLIAKNTTVLTIAIDLFQTYLFDMNFKSCVVEREHVKDDTFGKHTYVEDFELGDYVCRNETITASMCGDMCYLVGVTDSEENHIGSIFGKSYSGFALMYFAGNDTTALNNYIIDMCEKGKADSIAFIFTFPNSWMVKISTSLKSGDVFNGYQGALHEDVNIDSYYNNFEFNGENYKPRNNKTLIFPYNFITVYSPNGSSVILKYENFNVKPEQIKFRLETVLAQNAIFSLTPYEYCGKNLSLQDSIESQGYGLCSWNNDNYANWYAQHSNTIQAQSTNARISYNTQNSVASNNYKTSIENANSKKTQDEVNTGLSTLNSLGSLNLLGATSNALGGVVNAGINYDINTRNASNDLTNTLLLNSTDYNNTIRTLLASVKDAQVQPNTCKGDTSGCGLDVARDSNYFSIQQTQIKPEYAKIIDRYFQEFGYKVNYLKVPQFNSREKWNYLKTVNCVITGKIPHNDARALEDIFNNGITVWHDEKYMYNWNVDNDIKIIIEGEIS